MDQESICKACDGTGLLADDENWKYSCTVCGGTGVRPSSEKSSADLLSVDENNRVID